MMEGPNSILLNHWWLVRSRYASIYLAKRATWASHYRRCSGSTLKRTHSCIELSDLCKLGLAGILYLALQSPLLRSHVARN